MTRRRKPKAAQAYDYVERIEPKYSGWDPLPRRQVRKRVMRKLVRDAAVRAIMHACLGAGCAGKESPNETANRIAKELIP